MTGLLEELLVSLFGEPRVLQAGPLCEYRWRSGRTGAESILLKPRAWSHGLLDLHGELAAVYGDAVGGSLVDGSLKVAMLGGYELEWLYSIDELCSQPEVKDALSLDDGVSFFMDAANVWFYGIRRGELCVYDSETGELDELGPVPEELVTVVRQWEEAG